VLRIVGTDLDGDLPADAVRARDAPDDELH
jgi:hypothetical protein